MSDVIGNDAEVIVAATEAIKKDWRALRKAPKSLRRNKDVVMAAVKQDWHAVQFADEVESSIRPCMCRQILSVQCGF